MGFWMGGKNSACALCWTMVKAKHTGLDIILPEREPKKAEIYLKRGKLIFKSGSLIENNENLKKYVWGAIALWVLYH